MLINLRDKKGKLVVKDILSIDFDMMVEEKTEGEETKYYVNVNPDYNLDGEFENEDEAEEEMLWWSEARNVLENELRQY